jgi:long-chain acyl-CoA synthetase
MTEVDKYSSNFKGFERVKKITLTAEDFTLENNLLTPSLKVKRRFVWQKYGPQIEKLYAEDAKGKDAGAAA